MKEYEFRIESILASPPPNVPPAVNALLNSRQGAAKSFAAALMGRMGEIFQTLAENARNHRETGVTRDDLSSAMNAFIPQVRELAEMADDDALSLAWRVAFVLIDLSWTDDSVGYGDRPSDERADALFMELMKKMREAGTTASIGIDWADDLEHLNREKEQEKLCSRAMVP